VLALLLGPPPSCTATARTSPAATEPAWAPAAERRYLALHLDDQPVGGIETWIEPLPGGGARVGERLALAIRRVNAGTVDEFRVETLRRTEYAADDSLVVEETTRTEAGVVERTTVRLEGDELVLAYDGPGKKFEARYPRPADFRSSRAVFLELAARFAADGAPVELAYRVFSSDDQRFVAKTMRIQATQTVHRAGHSLPAWRVVERTEDGSVVEALVDEQYLPISMRMFDTFSATWVDESPFGPASVADITSELPVRGRVERWWELERLDLTVTVQGDDPTLPPVFASGPYQDVVRDGGTYKMRLHHTRLHAADRVPEFPIADPPSDAARFLAATPLSQSDDAVIRETARQITGERGNAGFAAHAIVAWVHDNLEKRSGARGSATATEVLATRAGDCTEHAALTVAFARAVGIPARNVDGIVLVGGPEGELVAGYHAWAELWLGRWVGVDAVFGEVGTSARYLALGYSEPGEIGTGARVARMVGKTSIVVEDHALFGADPSGR
jgi:transglutaminase-like putative cysteine protease